MAISFSFQLDNDILSVFAEGKDDHSQDVIHYAMAIRDEAIRQNTKKILCDERNLVYALGTFNTYEVAEFTSYNVPKVAKVAIVCNPENLSEANFYETVVVNRGLELKVFTDMEAARNWLD